MDKALKQRLVGATILIALAVIFLPMLLDGNGQDSMSGKMIEIPERPEVQFKTRRLPIGEQALKPAPQPKDRGVPDQPVPDHAPGELPESVADQEEKPAIESVLKSTPEPSIQDPIPAQIKNELATEAAEKLTEAVAGESQASIANQADPVAPVTPQATGGWLVQVASFGDGGNATRLANQLSQLGHAPLIATAAGPDGGLHRVRIGPFDSQATAQQALEQVAQTVANVKPRLLHPEGGETVTRPAGGFAVQVGSFSSPGNAEKLMVQLAALGINAFRERTDNAGGTIIKVKAGPVLDQLAANALRDQILSETGIRGLVIKLPD